MDDRRRSQYEGIDDVDSMTPTEEVPLSDPPRTPGSPKEKRAPLPPVTVTVTPTGDPPTVKVQAETAPVRPVVQTEPLNKDINIEDRDPTRMNDIVKVDFGDIFAEPVGSYSFDVIWRLSFRLFSLSKFWCYRITSAVCAIPLALCWGVAFACLTFERVWCSNPGLKVFKILLQPITLMWSLVLKLICDPLCHSCGHLFSNIRLTIKKEYQ